MKVLVLRLSSLGDLVLSTSVLPVFRSHNCSVDWVVKSEWSWILKGAEGIDSLIEFGPDRSLRCWIQLCRKLWEAQYSEVVDLQVSFRTLILRALFWLWGNKGKVPRFTVVKKERIRTWGFFVLKKKWPQSLRPRHWIERFEEASLRSMGGQGLPGMRGPNLSHLADFCAQKEPIISVMPSSRWDGKCWGAEKYASVLKVLDSEYQIQVLGTPKDVQSVKLVEILRSSGKNLIWGGGENWSPQELVRRIARSSYYLGGDTAISHIAQALNVPSLTIFGPTHSESGFGPWGAGARAIDSPLFCSPCGKDGRFCYRIFQRHRCQDEITPQNILTSIRSDRAPSAGEKPMPETGFLSLYRRFFRSRAVTSLSKWFLPEAQRYEVSEIQITHRPIWIHAASAGELESLWSFARLCLEKGHSIVLTIFSRSAESGLRKFLAETRDYSHQVLYGGYSPWEGRWEAAMKNFLPRAFVTSRYEAWPDLFASTSRMNCPVFVSSASPRKSLRVLRSVLKWMQIRPVNVELLVQTQEAKWELEKLFLESRVTLAPDPRWDRIKEKMRQDSNRAEFVIEKFLDPDASRIGVMGNAWPGDVKTLLDSGTQIPGQLWVVPHRMEDVSKIEKTFRNAGFQVRLTRSEAVPDMKSEVVIVNEMGILFHIYKVADWIWIGGGFGPRLHSPAEPAAYRVPMIAGQKGSARFPEFRNWKNLHWCKDSNGVRSVIANVFAPLKSGMQSEELIPFGGSSLLLERIDSVLTFSHDSSKHPSNTHELA